jgi:hypothetical protein
MTDVQHKRELSARQGARLTVGDNDVVWAYSGSTIYAKSGSVVYAFEGAKVYAQGGTVHAYKGSDVWGSGNSVLRVMEQGAYVEGGKGTTIHLHCGISALVKAKANLKVEHAEENFVEVGWSRRQLTVTGNEGCTIYGGTGNTLYVERGAIYL